MSEKKIKAFRKKFKQYQKIIMLRFLDSLKDVGLAIRLKVCFKLLFTNFRFFDKNKEVS